MLAPAGATPCPAITRTAWSAGSQSRIGTSPPGPFRCGSTTCSTKPVATAASAAFPPRSSTLMPTALASQCVLATIPKSPRRSGRVVKAGVGTSPRLATGRAPGTSTSLGTVAAMGHVLDGILHLPPALALALVFLFPAVEASVFVGVLVPGEIGIVLGGVLANQHKLALWAVLVAAIGGAIVGDSIGYWVGQRYGEWILRRLPNRIIDDDKIARAEQTVRRYGGRAGFVGRFTAAL